MELCIQKQLLFIYTMYRRFELTGDFFTMKLLLILFVALQLLLPYGNSYRIVSNRFTSLGIRDFLYLHKRQSVSCRNRINSVEDGLSMISTDSEMKQSLKGFQDFIRTNPMSDKISANYFHHIEFYAGDATSTYKRFMLALGMELIAKSDFSTGNTLHASYLLQSGEMRMMFTAPYPKRSNDSKADDSSNELNNNNNNVVDGKSPSIPSFDSDKAINFFSIHGLGVRAVAIHVSNVKDSYETVIKNGGKSVLPPTVVTDSTDKGSIEMAEVNLYGDTVLRLINDNNFSGSFLPNFEDCKKISKDSLKQTVGRYGIERFDHIVGNVWSLSPIVEQLKNMTGFHDFAEFVAEDVGTVDSGLNSVVLANNNEYVLLPLNEPTFGTKRKSQIQTYLEQYQGEGVQHMALATRDIFSTLKMMRDATEYGGFDFMDPQKGSYYDNLFDRIGNDAITVEELELARKYGVLVDRDDQGVLLQIFTKPFADRPTLFFEIIQRKGCIDSSTQMQKPGCGGFGKGNFKDLFKSIEDYENQLKLN